MSQDDLLAEIKQFIPEDKFDIFSERIGVVIELYQDIDDPKGVQKELQELARLSKKVNYTLVNVIKKVSPTTIRFLERFLPLPSYIYIVNILHTCSWIYLRYSFSTFFFTSSIIYLYC